MPAPEVSPEEFDALLTRVGNLEVAVSLRGKDAENTAGRVERIEALLRCFIDGDELAADRRRDKTRRKRELIAELASATGFGFTWKNARHIENILAGNCRAPAGRDSQAVLLRSLFGKPPTWETVWRHLDVHRDQSYFSEFTDD